MKGKLVRYQRRNEAVTSPKEARLVPTTKPRLLKAL